MQKAQSHHIRTSQVIVRKHDECFRDIAYVCQISRRIKNATHYLIRHEKKSNGKPFSHSDADKWLKTNNADLYKKLPSAIAQRTTQIAGQEWSSFFAAKKQFDKHPELFKARPKPPRYANKATTAYIGRNGFRVVEGVVYFAGDVIPPIKTQYSFNQDWNAKVSDTVLREVRFVPKGNCYIIELIVDEAELVTSGQYCPLLDKSRHAGIDLGIDNLMAIATNQPDIHPALVKGTGLKSINAWYNKRVAKLRSLGKYDHIPTKGDDVIPTFSGRRVKRGLYKADSGQLINADINAALNILRKESGELVACRGLMDRPTVFYPIDRVTVRKGRSMPLAA